MFITYIPFKILSVKALLNENALLIESTHGIEPQSVHAENIRITQPSSPVEDLSWEHFEIEGKLIKLFLKDQPQINTRYIVRIKALKNIVDDTLESSYNQEIEFVSVVRSTITFKAPLMHSVVPSLTLVIDEQLHEGHEKHADYFEYELSNEPLFMANHLLVERETTSQKEITFHLGDYEGQVFIRCRAYYHNESGEHTCFSDWIQTTCIVRSVCCVDECVNPSIQLTFDSVEVPQDNTVTKDFVYVFDVDTVTRVGEIHVSAESISDNVFTPITVKQCILFENRVIIVPVDVIPTNSIIHVEMKDIVGGIRTLSRYTHSFYSKLENCYADIKDVLHLIYLDDITDTKFIYYHLLEASRMADYYIQIKRDSDTRNMKYYRNADDLCLIEKNMFVKYYAASQILAHLRTKTAYEASFSGKLGEIEYTPKGSLPDITQALKALIDEAEKWKLALQGYKAISGAPSSAIKSKKYLGYLQNRGR